MNNKTLLATTLVASTLLFSHNSMAHDEGMVNNHCDVKFVNKVSITPNHILVIKNNQTLYDIYDNETVFYKGQKLSLNESETQLVREFSEETRTLIPAITDIALEAVTIAFDGIKIGLGQFTDTSTLDTKLANIQQRLERKFSSQDGYYMFNEGDFEMDFADEELDRAIEETVEEALPSVIGGVLQLVGSAIANGDTDLSELNNLESRIENEIEARAEVLEEKADQICERVELLAQLEASIQSLTPQLNDFDLIEIKRNHRN